MCQENLDIIKSWQQQYSYLENDAALNTQYTYNIIDMLVKMSQDQMDASSMDNYFNLLKEDLATNDVNHDTPETAYEYALCGTAFKYNYNKKKVKAKEVIEIGLKYFPKNKMLLGVKSSI